MLNTIVMNPMNWINPSVKMNGRHSFVSPCLFSDVFYDVNQYNEKKDNFDLFISPSNGENEKGPGIRVKLRMRYPLISKYLYSFE